VGELQVSTNLDVMGQVRRGRAFDGGTNLPKGVEADSISVCQAALFDTDVFGVGVDLESGVLCAPEGSAGDGAVLEEDAFDCVVGVLAFYDDGCFDGPADVLEGDAADAAGGIDLILPPGRGGYLSGCQRGCAGKDQRDKPICAIHGFPSRFSVLNCGRSYHSR
jgi:hypothetical protein